MRFSQVDVFGDGGVTGNPLAVVHDADGLDDAAMQAFASWTNLSETTFLLPATDPAADYRVRIFTGSGELPFAGHPTLGTAFVIGQPMQLETIVIETGSGPVPVRLEREGPKIVFGRMEQPIPSIEPFDEGPLLAALGIERSELPVELYDNGMRHVYVALGSEDEVVAVEPDMNAIARLGSPLGVNCFGGSGTAWKNRMFAPSSGVRTGG